MGGCQAAGRRRPGNLVSGAEVATAVLLCGAQQVSLQQLSAKFGRGDLIELLGGEVTDEAAVEA